MIVCLCTGVTHAEFTKALEDSEGDWIVASMETGAGMCCGGCRHFISQIAVREATKQEKEGGEPQTDIATT